MWSCFLRGARIVSSKEGDGQQEMATHRGVPRGRAPGAVRVCFVVENLQAAGTEMWIVKLIEQLDRSRIVPSLCLVDGTIAASRALEPEGVPVLRLGLPHLKTARLFWAARRLARFLHEQQVEILQLHHADPTYLALPVARWCRVRRVVQTKFDVGYWYSSVDRWLYPWLQRWVDATVANCQACRQAAITQDRVSRDSVQVIDNGIDVRPFQRIAPLAVDGRRQLSRIGMVANLRPIKRPELLVQAVAMLVDRHPEIRVQIAGEGELQVPLAGQIARHGLSHRVELLGRVDDIPAFWQAQDIGVLCSLSEGLPHALIEAMASARPVIATDVGGNRELVEDGVNGLLVPADQPASLAAAIDRMLSCPGVARRYGLAARRTVAPRFSLDAMTERFTNFYQQLLFGESGAKVPLANRVDDRMAEMAKR